MNWLRLHSMDLGNPSCEDGRAVVRVEVRWLDQTGFVWTWCHNIDIN